MDRSSEIDDIDESEVEATMLLTGDHMMLIMKALDVYAYGLIMANAQGELNAVKEVAEIIYKELPQPELDS